MCQTQLNCRCTPIHRICHIPRKFLPKLSDICKPLRKLTQKDIEWHWTSEHEYAVKQIKDLVTAEPVLQYSNPVKPLTMQCDASEKGLGAALLQDERPIAFASRALTETETRYAQIEKELLAVLFGLEKSMLILSGDQSMPNQTTSLWRLL